MKQKHTLHLYQIVDTGAKIIEEVDWRIYGDGCMTNRIYLGTHEVEIDWPEDNGMIEALESQIVKERAASQMRINILLDRISSLKAITHEVAE